MAVDNSHNNKHFTVSLGPCCRLQSLDSQNPMGSALRFQLVSEQVSSKRTVRTPRHTHTHTLTHTHIFGRRAFTVAGPTAWNSLPDYLRDPSLSEDHF